MSLKFVGQESDTNTTSQSDAFGNAISGAPIIKVIGLGGGGGNAVNYMYDHHINGVEYICANTDAQALVASPITNKIQLGESGLGAGANPDKGRDATLEQQELIKDSIKDADMVFITAGMGGGTGTGSAPVVAKIARDLGILTVGVVSEPFSFERGRRNKVAKEGIANLSEHVDSLICVPNDKLMEVLGEDFNLNDAFAHANEVLFEAVQGITEIVTVPGVINVDFEDLRTVMSEQGSAMMGMGISSGEDRAVKATQRAIENPLLDNVKIEGARGILVNISSANTLSIGEFHKVGTELDRLIGGDDETTVIIGTSIDDSLGEEVRVMVVATGLESIDAVRQIAPGSAQEKSATVTTAETVSETLQQPESVSHVQAISTSTYEGEERRVNLIDSSKAINGNVQVMQAVVKEPVEIKREDVAKIAVGDYDMSHSESWLDVPAFLRRQVD
jgi:cell division protein FtsZ